MAQDQEHREIEQWLAGELSSRLSQVLEAMTGEPRKVEWKAATSSQSAALFDAKAKALWWRQPITVASNACAWMAASEEAWLHQGTKILEAAGVEAQPEESRSTYLETLSQALSGVAQSLTGRLRKEVLADGGSQGSPPEDGYSSLFSFTASSDKEKSPPIYAAFNDVLVQSLAQSGKIVAPKPAAAPPAPSNLPTKSPAAEPAPSKTFELLLDVELPVSVSFGRAQLPLKDVIKLTTGSIVELNRSISEPVEVIVNNCVIARGEVVVIEGNYGVRIEQIISRQERLRTLK